MLEINEMLFIYKTLSENLNELSENYNLKYSGNDSLLSPKERELLERTEKALKIVEDKLDGIK